MKKFFNYKLPIDIISIALSIYTDAYLKSKKFVFSDGLNTLAIANIIKPLDNTISVLKYPKLNPRLKIPIAIATAAPTLDIAIINLVLSTPYHDGNVGIPADA